MQIENKISVVKIYRVHSSLTKEDWQLYLSDSNICAIALNESLNTYTQRSNDKNKIKKDMHELMYAWRHYGAYDTEPLNVLENVLDYIYGK